MVANLFFILSLGVDKDMGNEDGENVFEVFPCKVELGPVVTVLQDLQHVT